MQFRQFNMCHSELNRSSGARRPRRLLPPYVLCAGTFYREHMVLCMHASQRMETN